MRKLLQGFIAGILSGIVVTGTIGVFAYTDYIEVVYNNIKIVVDGKEIRPNSEPFISNGTTYLPVRAVSEALGKEVLWDGTSNIVYIGKTISNSEKLINLTNIGEGWGETDILTDNYGNRYTYALRNNGAGKGFGYEYGNYTGQYLLNGKYNRLKGTLYICKG